MAQRSMDFYLSKKPITSQSKPNKRKALKISSDEDESPSKSKSIAKKKPKVEETPVSVKKQKIKAESLAALFGGELRRESKQKAIHSPIKKDNDVDCELEPVSDTSFSTPTKSDNAFPTLRRSSRTPKKLSLFSEEKLNPQKKETIKCEFKEEASTQFRSSPRKKESVKKTIVAESSNGNANKKQRDQKGVPVKEKSINNKAKENEINLLKHEANQSSAKKKTHKEANVTDLETSVLSDEERFERKRMAAMLYQKRLNRPSVINRGSREAPEGAPNCLAGLSFCITGVLESFTSEEAAEIIKGLGGKKCTSVGKRLNYLVAGEDAGPKKLSDAENLSIPILSLDELFELIKEKSNNETKSMTRISPRKKIVERTSPFKVIREDKVSPAEVKKEAKLSPRKKIVEATIPFKIKNEDEISPVKIKEEEQKKTSANVGLSKIRVGDELIGKETNDNMASIAANPVNDDNIAWVDKYRPTSLKQIIGQQGAASNCTKLIHWLKNWHSNQSGGKKLQKPNPWAKNDDGCYYKAALLSGPPGVGKTTTATLVCKDLCFDAVEFNASDTRSKRLLKEEVSELLSNKSLYGYFHGNDQAVSKKHVLIMDEVDGMAGNEDRGGIQELIALIKDSHVPIICMCNDRNHQKMRSLVNYCYDLRFIKPRLEQIKGFVKSICFKEKVKLSSEKIDEIILATNNDIRQSINHLCLLSAGKDIELTFGSEKTAQKDLKMGPWEVVRKVFSADEHKHMSLVNKLDLFFHDYSMSPLFVQQNYLTVCPDGPRSEVLKKVALSADALSIGDLVDRRIRTNSAWTLLPVQAVFSSFLPGEYMEGHFTGQINFPGWLGKYSRTNKRSRLAQEIHDHTRLRTSGSRLSIRMDYSPFLLSHIVRPLQDKGMQGVAESLKVIQEYRLLREDIDSLIELTTWPGKKSPMDAVEGKTKAALTRLYNKEVLPYSYSAITAAKKKKCEAADGDIPLDLMENETETVESDEEQDNLENDNLIKAKKTTLASSKPTGSKSNKTTSSQKTSSVKTRK